MVIGSLLSFPKAFGVIFTPGGDCLLLYSLQSTIRITRMTSSRERPDLIILDLMMPKLNGLEVCSAVRAEARFDDMRIVMLTAKGREAEMDKGLSVGADAYIAKPFSTRDLVEQVKLLLGPAS